MFSFDSLDTECCRIACSQNTGDTVFLTMAIRKSGYAFAPTHIGIRHGLLFCRNQVFAAAHVILDFMVLRQNARL